MSNRKLKIENAPDPSSQKERDAARKAFLEKWHKAYVGRPEKVEGTTARKERLQETDNARTYKYELEMIPFSKRDPNGRYWGGERRADAYEAYQASEEARKKRLKEQETENRFCETENAKLSADECEFRKAAKKYAKDKAEKNLFSLFPAPTREALRQEKEREASLYGFMTGRRGGATPPWRKKNA